MPGVGEITEGGSLERNVRIWVDAAGARRARAHRRRRDRARCGASTSSCPRAASRRRAARSTCASSARRSTSRRCATSSCRRASRRATRRSTSRTWRWSRTASRTSAASRASTASRRRGWASASSAAPTPWPWRRACAPRWPRSQKTLPPGMKLEHQLRLDPVHRGVGPRDRVRAPPRGPPHRARLLALPRLALQHAQRRARHPDVAPRHGGGHLLPRLHPQHLHPARAGLAVGIVVDDAIMVLENIFRHAEAGKDRVTAAREGTREITFAALAATLAVVRHLHPRRLHEGDHRQVLPAVRRHPLRRGAALLPRGDDAGAGALRADPRRLARAPRAGWAGPSTAAFARLAQALRAGAALGARAGPVGCSPAASLLFGARDRRLPRPAEGVRAVAGPERGHDPPADGASAPTSTRPTGSCAAARSICSPGPRCCASSRSSAASAAAASTAGVLFVTLVPPGEREATQAEFSADAPQGAQLLSRACARSSRTSRSRASPRSAASRSSSRCAARTGTS